ncbi:putative ribonuclease H protein, partial [Ananas comosus]
GLSSDRGTYQRSGRGGAEDGKWQQILDAFLGTFSDGIPLQIGWRMIEMMIQWMERAHLDMGDSVEECRKKVLSRNHSLTLNLKHLATGNCFYLTNVYGPPSWDGKEEFCIELLSLSEICANNWVICGDFNLTRNQAERTGRLWSTRAMNMFSDLIAKLDVIDLPISNQNYTWSNMQSTPTLAKLDRFLVSMEWDQSYPQYGSTSNRNCNSFSRRKRSSGRRERNSTGLKKETTIRKARIEGWKAKLLSHGGRLVLVNSVLSNISLFYFAIFKAPQWVLKRIEALRRSFFWKGCSKITGGACLVGWRSICKSKKEGGLGVKDMEAMNTALLTW